jgi:hypothetical protein
MLRNGMPLSVTEDGDLHTTPQAVDSPSKPELIGRRGLPKDRSRVHPSSPILSHPDPSDLPSRCHVAPCYLTLKPDESNICFNVIEERYHRHSLPQSLGLCPVARGVKGGLNRDRLKAMLSICNETKLPGSVGTSPGVALLSEIATTRIVKSLG